MSPKLCVSDFIVRELYISTDLVWQDRFLGIKWAEVMSNHRQMGWNIMIYTWTKRVITQRWVEEYYLNLALIEDWVIQGHEGMYQMDGQRARSLQSIGNPGVKRLIFFWQSEVHKLCNTFNTRKSGAIRVVNYRQFVPPPHFSVIFPPKRNECLKITSEGPSQLKVVTWMIQRHMKWILKLNGTFIEEFVQFIINIIKTHTHGKAKRNQAVFLHLLRTVSCLII